MAFITVANSKRILKELDVNELNLQGDVYDKPIRFFSKKEKQFLLAYKELLVNPEKIIKDTYIKIKSKDSCNYVYEGGAPCYHRIAECERLNAVFRNFVIPQEIRDKGVEAVQQFRSWFKSNYYLFEGKEDVFEMRAYARFKMRLKVEELIRDNSGITVIVNRTLEDLKDEIDKKLNLAGQYYYQSPKNTSILKQYSKCAYIGNRSEPLKENETGYSEQEIKDILSYYEKEFKKPIELMLYDYWRVKLNPELSMDGKLLDMLGFRACHSCYF